MENNTHKIETPQSQEQMLAEILDNSRKSKNYMKWQLIITIGLVVIPLLAGVIIIPIVISSLTTAYSGILQ
ncbi:TPA: hypothetical protein DCG61_03405 [Patescibacteria group bacterium]|jgi:hypothetical protein|nr:hypothetical protein [Patescibacteria group bacterium]